MNSMNRLMLATALFAAPVLAADVPSAPASPSIIVDSTAPVVKVSQQESEKLICHKETVIGSLIAKKRVCMTQRNWDRNAKNAQDNLQELTKPGAFGPNG